jgi:hypothetical protein
MLKLLMRISVSLFICALLTLNVSGQKKFISGIVKDAHSDERIPFASIQFMHSTIGKLSDSAGTFYFYLDEWPSDTLVFTYVGYQPC